MAGDWIKIEHVTPDKPEVFRMADHLGIDPDAVVGKLCRIWIWADQQTVDGNAPSVTKTLVDRFTNVAGFADAMMLVGWLSEVDNGLQFINFEAHNGQTAKSRALTARRVAKHKQKTNADSVTEALPRALPREEKRREDTKKEKSKKKKESQPGYTPDFEQFWEACTRKESKGNAWKSWAKALKQCESSTKRLEDESPGDFLTRRMRDYSAFTADKDRQYVKLPATWLNQGCWDDEMGSRVATDDDLKNWRP